MKKLHTHTPSRSAVINPSNFSRRQATLFAILFALFGALVVFLSHAAASPIASIEAESMTLPQGGSIVTDSTASGGRGALLSTTGSASAPASFASTAVKLVVRAKGSYCSGFPQMSVNVDGVPVLGSAVSASTWTEYPVVTNLAAGTHAVSAEFTNPFTEYSGNSGNVKCQRKLYLDVITFYGPAVPTTPLTASMKTPTNGSTVSGGVPVEAMATGSNGVAKVEFYLDGALNKTEGVAPYCMAGDNGSLPCNNWDSTTVPNGSHTITAYAYDSAGLKSAASTSTFTVNNGITVKIINPASGSTVTGGIPVEATATSSSGIAKVEFYLDGVLNKTENIAPYCMASDSGVAPCYNWDSKSVANGSHTITAYAYDSAGIKSPASTVVFNVNNTIVASTPCNGYQPVYADNFDGTVLNTTTTDLTKAVSAWQPYYGPGHNNNGLRRPEAFSLDGVGNLVITASMNSSNQIVSGGMSNKTNMAYGCYETRVRTEADTTGTMSGVILTWPQSGVWPGDGELDWYETGTSPTRNPFSTFIHYPCNEYGGTCPTPYQTQFVHNADAKDWHTITMQWSPTYIKMFRDGLLVQTTYGEGPTPLDAITNVQHIPDVAHHVSVQLDALANRTLAQPVHMYVDYVKVYK